MIQRDCDFPNTILKDKIDMMKLQEDLKRILESVNVAIFIDDGEGYELWINKAAEELYGIDRNQVIGKNMSDLEREGIFSPSLTSTIIKERVGQSIIHENIMGKKLMTSGVPVFNDNNEIEMVVTSSVDITRLVALENELQQAQEALEQFKGYEGFPFGEMVVTSHVMQNIMTLSKRLAQVDSNILITGESGTGKGLIAKLIHDNGKGKDFPFVSINCGAIPDNLLESEFFGYEQGAFTGSKKGGKKGLFEIAHNGTVFLDEIAELPLNLQVKILKVIQDREIQKVGGVESIPVNVRIIAATNKSLEDMIEKGTFREDLFYRLNVVPIKIPPLRERPEDILSMIRYFLKKNNEKFGEDKNFTSNTIAVMLKYGWPGNVRELENIIEMLVITTKGKTIVPDDLPEHMRNATKSQIEVALKRGLGLKETLEITERQILLAASKEYDTTRKIANYLGVDQSTVVRKLKKYNISTKDA